MTRVRRAKVDQNQKEIVNQLRKAGYSVLHLHAVGEGCPDICVGKDGVNYLLEIKNKAGKLTPKQEIFFDSWQGTAHVVRTFEQALEVLRAG